MYLYALFGSFSSKKSFSVKKVFFLKNVSEF